MNCFGDSASESLATQCGPRASSIRNADSQALPQTRPCSKQLFNKTSRMDLHITFEKRWSKLEVLRRGYTPGSPAELLKVPVTRRHLATSEGQTEHQRVLRLSKGFQQRSEGDALPCPGTEAALVTMRSFQSVCAPDATTVSEASSVTMLHVHDCNACLAQRTPVPPSTPRLKAFSSLMQRKKSFFSHSREKILLSLTFHGPLYVSMISLVTLRFNDTFTCRWTGDPREQLLRHLFLHP